MGQQEAAWHKAQQAAQAAAADDAERQQRERRRIMQQFDLQVVNSGGSGGRSGKHAPGLDPWAPAEGGNGTKVRGRTDCTDSRSGFDMSAWHQVVTGCTCIVTQVRYRDGRLVSTKGERFILLAKPGDDYDSGSRGKVYTKVHKPCLLVVTWKERTSACFCRCIAWVMNLTSWQPCCAGETGQGHCVIMWRTGGKQVWQRPCSGGGADSSPCCKNDPCKAAAGPLPASPFQRRPSALFWPPSSATNSASAAGVRSACAIALLGFSMHTSCAVSGSVVFA